MKSIALAAVLLTVILATSSTQAQDDKAKTAEPAAAKLESARDRVSYSIGVSIGNQLRRQNLQVDPKIVARALADVLGGNDLALSAEEMQAAFADYQKEQAENRRLLGEKNKVEGPKFLAENRKKPGIKVTDSGLQYQILKAGTGATPKATDRVFTHYRGRLIDGTVFDESYKGEKPNAEDELVDFTVDGVIGGWTEALQLMKAGSKWRLFIPSELAYKERGAGADIGPHAVLIFDIELVRIGK